MKEQLLELPRVHFQKSAYEETLNEEMPLSEDVSSARSYRYCTARSTLGLL